MAALNFLSKVHYNLQHMWDKSFMKRSINTKEHLQLAKKLNVYKNGIIDACSTVDIFIQFHPRS